MEAIRWTVNQVLTDSLLDALWYSSTYSSCRHSSGFSPSTYSSSTYSLSKSLSDTLVDTQVDDLPTGVSPAECNLSRLSPNIFAEHSLSEEILFQSTYSPPAFGDALKD